MDREITMFKPVACKDFPGWYEIPGFSKHAANRKGEILTKKTGNSTKGGDVGHYLKVSVYPDGAKEPKMEYVSHLILKAFQGPRPAGMVAMHKDDNKHNNKNNNLKWATQSDNIKLTYKNGLRKPANGYTVSKEGLFDKVFGRTELTKKKVKSVIESNEFKEWLKASTDNPTEVKIQLSKDLVHTFSRPNPSSNPVNDSMEVLDELSRLLKRVIPLVEREEVIVRDTEHALSSVKTPEDSENRASDLERALVATGHYSTNKKRQSTPSAVEELGKIKVNLFSGVMGLVKNGWVDSKKTDNSTNSNIELTIPSKSLLKIRAIRNEAKELDSRYLKINKKLKYEFGLGLEDYPGIEEINPKLLEELERLTGSHTRFTSLFTLIGEELLRDLDLVLDTLLTALYVNKDKK